MLFQLSREAFGLEHPKYDGISGADKERSLEQSMDIYQRVVERYGWDALMTLNPPQDPAAVAAAKRRFGSDLLVGGIVWEGIWSIDIIKDWDKFSEDLFDRPETVHEGAERLRVVRPAGERLGVDGRLARQLRGGRGHRSHRPRRRGKAGVARRILDLFRLAGPRFGAAQGKREPAD
jgi:PAS domain-containing protein